MEKITLHNESLLPSNGEFEKKDLRRRDFLKFAGASAASLAILGMASCKKDHDDDNGNSGKGMYFGSGDIAILNYAYALEQLEAEYYTMGVAKAGLIPSGKPLGAITTIRDHEVAHLNFLKQVLGNKAVSKPTFDFTAGGTFGNVFSNYDTFLAVAQAFEDTGVRVYKSQAYITWQSGHIDSSLTDSLSRSKTCRPHPSNEACSRR